MIKILKSILSIFNNVYNYIILKIKKVKYNNGLVINGRLSVHGSGFIQIGSKVVLNSSPASNPIGGQGKTFLKAEGRGQILIGNNVGISNSAICAFDCVTIEDNVMIGGSCKIYDTDFHSINYENRMMNPDPDIKSRPVIIKKGAFIGAHSIILKGVTIGERAVIGAGSVVTKDVGENEIWAGNPARFIRRI